MVVKGPSVLAVGGVSSISALLFAYSPILLNFSLRPSTSSSVHFLPFFGRRHKMIQSIDVSSNKNSIAPDKRGYPHKFSYFSIKADVVGTH